MKLTLTARVERVVIILLVLVGVVLRLRQYAANRSLWLLAGAERLSGEIRGLPVMAASYS